MILSDIRTTELAITADSILCAKMAGGVRVMSDGTKNQIMGSCGACWDCKNWLRRLVKQTKQNGVICFYCSLTLLEFRLNSLQFISKNIAIDLADD
jgi:hypothetical protein